MTTPSSGDTSAAHPRFESILLADTQLIGDQLIRGTH